MRSDGLSEIANTFLSISLLAVMVLPTPNVRALPAAGGEAAPHQGEVLLEGEAPHDGMFSGRWSSGVKQMFGTAFEAYDSANKYSANSSTFPISKVWFTGAQGILSEIFWPTIDTPQVRDLQFLVTDGQGFFQEERRSPKVEIHWIKDGVPEFVSTSGDQDNRYTIEKTIFSDPSSDALLVKVKIKSNVDGLHFYVLHNPAVSNSPMGDYGFVRSGAENDQGLFAYQGQEAQALKVTVPFKAASAAFSGPYDGYQDLQKNRHLTHEFRMANNGEVVLTGELEIPAHKGEYSFVMALGFGTTTAAAGAVADLAMSHVDEAEKLFQAQWESYQASVEDLSSVSLDGGKTFRASVAVLKSMEDKTYEGAFVAAPVVPWGEHTPDNTGGPQSDVYRELYKDRPRQNLTGGYHLVWPRDLYMMATTMMAIGDFDSARAALNRLQAVQYGPQDGTYPFWGHRRIPKNGTWPQNFWTSGEAWWTGLQVDEVAMPVVLGYRLWVAKKIELSHYWDMLSRASDMLEAYGPWTNQDRWEESFGASPSTIASEIAALWSAAKMAEAMGDSERARRYRAKADAWAAEPGNNVDAWTFTTTGTQGNGRYFERLDGSANFDQVWNPNDDTEYYLANNGGRHREKDVLDGGFLELVRFGIKSALDVNVVDTMPEYDQTLRVDVPYYGPGFRRYLYDRYNYDDFSGQQTAGMLWPLLTGERGHFELAKAIEIRQSPMQINAAVNPYLQAIEKFATDTHMIPEQVWDYGPLAGRPTGAATPLGWAHGEYIKLLRSKRDRAIFDDIAAVKERADLLTPLSWPEIRDLTQSESVDE